MFQEDKEITDAVGRLFIYCNGKVRGDVISWGECEASTGMTYGTSRFQTACNRARRRLLRDCGIATWCKDNGVGFCMLTESEQLNHGAINRRRRANGQIRRGIRELELCSDDQLTDHEKIFRIRNHDAMINEKRSLSRAVRDESVSVDMPQRK